MTDTVINKYIEVASSENEFSQQLNRLLDNSKLREQLGLSGYEFIKSSNSFSTEQAIRNVASTILKISAGTEI